jgi:hypothetical protein
MSMQIGFLAWKGQMEEGFSLVWPLLGYVMRGRKEVGRGYQGLIEDLDGYGPTFKGQNIHLGAFRSDGWCVLLDSMLDKHSLERAARRLSVNFKKATVAAMIDSPKRRYYVGYWDSGRHLGHVFTDIPSGKVDVEGNLINGHIDPAAWTQDDWLNALTELGIDMDAWERLDQEEAEFEVLEVRREFVPELEDEKPKATARIKPWWKLWG